MTLAGDAFEPIDSDEAALAEKPKAKPDKVPIVPVPVDAPECNFKIPRLGGAPKRLWEYRDAEGRLLGYDARFEYVEDGKPCKDVMPVTFCQEGDKRAWRSKALPAPRSLYGLDRLAARPTAPVVITEGAKCADAVAILFPDHVAVSWQGGANAIRMSSWAPLEGRAVLIWPDRDRQCDLAGKEKPYDEQPGPIAAENIVACLKGVAASVRNLDLSEYDCADGWDAADAVEDGWTPALAAKFVETHARDIEVDGPDTILPFHFEYGLDGLFYVENENRRLRVCGRLKVLAKTRDAGGGSWGLLLEWRDADGTVHRWAMPMAMLAGDGGSVREGLFDRGLFVSTDPKARARLLEFLAAVDTPIRATAVTKVGWAREAFALPHITIGDTPTERVIFQHPEAGPHQYQSLGTLQQWQDNVAKLAMGNSRLVFMMAAAFVGPVLTPACEEGGGANLVGSSSTGKTTGLAGAASVWGPPAFMRTWRATGNGLEGVAAQHSETLLCLDELGQLEPREAGQVAYMLGNGQGKQRASRSGGSRAAASWKLMYLSTGEIGLAELAREGKQSRSPQAGQEVRILDIPADAGKGMGIFERINGDFTPEAFSRHIKSAASEYYGTASIAFVERLVPIRDQIGDMIAASIRDFMRLHVPPESDGQVQRAGRRFGLVAAAGELAIALGVLPWDRLEAFGAAAVLFRAWIDRRGGTGSAEERNILGQVRAFFEAHGDTRFSSSEDDIKDPRLVLNRAGFYRTTLADDGTTIREYWVLPQAFAEICHGHDRTAVINALTKTGALRSARDGKPSDNRRLPGMGSKKVYIIGPEVFEDDGGTSADR